MPIVEIHLIEGRTEEQRRALITAVTDAVEKAIGARRDSIRVLLQEYPCTHWSVGGIPRSESERRDAADRH